MQIFNIDLKKDILIIGEIGINHEGKLKEAKKIIKLAATCGLNAVKFQLYNLEKYESKNNIQRYNRLKNFNLKDKDYIYLKAEAKRLGLNVLATPLTEDKVKLAASFGEVVKVASGDINFYPTIEKIIKLKKKIILSTGNSTLEEINKTINYIKEKSKQTYKDLAILHCVSLYPAPIEKSNIKKISYLKKKYPNLTIGYSNHCSQKEAVLSAVALGAKIIEIHITHDKRNKEFRDHALSFDKKSLKNLVDSINFTHKAVSSFSLNPEKDQFKIRKFMRKGIVASKNINVGEEFTKANLHYARPAVYFQSSDLKKLLGKKSKKKYKIGYSIK
jgi:N,N'-diacetyllegionaminate synthase